MRAGDKTKRDMKRRREEWVEMWWEERTRETGDERRQKRNEKWREREEKRLMSFCRRQVNCFIKRMTVIRDEKQEKWRDERADEKRQRAESLQRLRNILYFRKREKDRANKREVETSRLWLFHYCSTTTESDMKSQFHYIRFIWLFYWTV